MIDPTGSAGRAGTVEGWTNVSGAGTSCPSNGSKKRWGEVKELAGANKFCIVCVRAWFVEACSDDGEDGLGDRSSADFVNESLLLSPLDAVESFRREFLGRRDVVVLYIHGSENRRQCLHIGCSPEQRI